MLVAPLAIKQPKPPLLTLDVYAPHSLRLTSNSWGHFTFSHKTACLFCCLPLSLSVCLTSHVRPPACLCLCILPSAFPISPLLSIIIILSLLDFIVHTAFDHCLAVRERPAATRVHRSHNQLLHGFSICTPSVRLGLWSAISLLGKSGPFLFTLSPPAREAPSSSHRSRLETRHLPVLSFFFSSSPLELSASLDLLAHRPNSRDLFPCRHLCTCG